MASTSIRLGLWGRTVILLSAVMLLLNLISHVETAFAGTDQVSAVPAVSTVAYSLADLEGVWYSNILASGPGSPWWERGTITVSANGSFSGWGQESDGNSDSLTGTLNISSDGIVTLTDNELVLCYLEAGKTVMVCTSTWTTWIPGTPEMNVFTKKATTYSQADLAGNWEINSLASGPGAPWWMRMTSTIDANGVTSGAVTYSDGTSKVTTRTMSISSDGIITCTSDCKDPTFRCTLDADKKVAVCTDTWTTGSPGTTELTVMTKMANSYSQSDLTGVWGFNSLSSGSNNVWARTLLTIASDGALSGIESVSDGTTRQASGIMSISANGIVTNDRYANLRCTMDADKTVISCVDTESHNSGTAEMIIMTRQESLPVTVSHSGDMDESGSVDISDALKALRVTVKLESETDACLTYGDVAPLGADGKPAPDGKININDALLILKKVVRLVNW